MITEYLRRALQLSYFAPMVLVQRPINATLLALAAAAMIVVLMLSLRENREKAFHEE
jgi:TctA family transporter